MRITDVNEGSKSNSCRRNIRLYFLLEAKLIRPS